MTVINLREYNEELTREVTGKPLAAIDQPLNIAPQRGIPVYTGQRWIRLGQRDLNPPIDCYEQLHIAWYIEKKHGDVSPTWLIAHSDA